VNANEFLEKAAFAENEKILFSKLCFRKVENPKIKKLQMMQRKIFTNTNKSEQNIDESEINSLNFILKDSLFFKKNKKTQDSKHKAKIQLENIIFTSFHEQKKDNFINYIINSQINSPKLNNKICFPNEKDEINGVCSKEIFTYFSEILNDFVQKYLSIPSGSLPKDNNIIIKGFFDHIVNISNKLKENVENTQIFL